MATNQRGKEKEILKAATIVFSDKGFHNANMGEIAQRAGIGKGTIYEYFKNKEDLFFQMADFNLEHYIASLNDRVQSAVGFDEKFHGFIDFHYELVNRNMKLADFLFKSEQISLKAETKKKVADVLFNARARAVGIIADILRIGQQEGKIRDIDREFTADILINMILGCCGRHATRKQRDEGFALEKEKLMSMIMEGIG